MSFERVCSLYSYSSMRDSSLHGPTLPHLVHLRRLLPPDESAAAPLRPPFAVLERERMAPAPYSTTIPYWQPSPSLFASMGMRDTSGKPHTPHGFNGFPRGEQPRVSRTARPQSSHAGWMRYYPASQGLFPEDPVPAGPLLRPTESRAWITSSQSIATGCENSRRHRGSLPACRR